MIDDACPNDFSHHTSPGECTCPPAPFDYHDCGDPDCRALGAPLPEPPADWSAEQIEVYVREFHEAPCPPAQPAQNIPPMCHLCGAPEFVVRDPERYFHLDGGFPVRHQCPALGTQSPGIGP